MIKALAVFLIVLVAVFIAKCMENMNYSDLRDYLKPVAILIAAIIGKGFFKKIVRSHKNENSNRKENTYYDSNNFQKRNNLESIMKYNVDEISTKKLEITLKQLSETILFVGTNSFFESKNKYIEIINRWADDPFIADVCEWEVSYLFNAISYSISEYMSKQNGIIELETVKKEYLTLYHRALNKKLTDEMANFHLHQLKLRIDAYSLAADFKNSSYNDVGNILMILIILTASKNKKIDFTESLKWFLEKYANYPEDDIDMTMLEIYGNQIWTLEKFIKNFDEYKGKGASDKNANAQVEDDIKKMAYILKDTYSSFDIH